MLPKKENNMKNLYDNDYICKNLFEIMDLINIEKHWLEIARIYYENSTRDFDTNLQMIFETMDNQNKKAYDYAQDYVKDYMVIG